MPSPNPAIVHVNNETNRQRELGKLRAQQRAAVPLIMVLREQRHITTEMGKIEIEFKDDEAVIIAVHHNCVTPEMIENVRRNTLGRETE